MSIFSFYFLLFLCVLVLLFHGTPSVRYRHALLTAANAVFLATFLASGWNVGILLGCVLAGYASLLILRWRPRRSTLVLCITWAVAALVLLKRYAFLEPIVPDRILHHSIELIGISYLTFKYIHVAVDLKQGQLEQLDLLTYLNYQLGFFSLVAGPIQRYNDFAAFWRNIGVARADLRALQHWRRTLGGLLRMGVLGSIAWFLYDLGAAQLARGGTRLESLAGLLLVFYAYPAFIYFNFAGYCDAVIGAAGVLGMKQQENFNRPILARNLLEFWNRWHISLTMWIRDYVFTPLYKAAATHWQRLAVPLGYGALFVALFLAGMWHGATWNFAVFGLLHGIGVMTVQIYGDNLKRRLGRQGVKRYLANPVIRSVAMLVTIHYVCVTFLFFRPGLRQTLALLSRAGREILL